jgi:hypothetical protein
MTNAQARQIIDSLGLPAVQSAAAGRTLRRATASEDIDVHRMPNGDLFITRSRPGFVGRQVFEDTIAPDGTKQVIQKAYDSAGNEIHFDPKGGTP